MKYLNLQTELRSQEAIAALCAVLDIALQPDLQSLLVDLVSKMSGHFWRKSINY